LKNLGLIERHLPDLIELIGRLKMTLHSITDQRKAYDAMKGLHQTEHKQQEQLQRAQEQKRVIEEVKKEMGHLNGDLKSLLEWMAFISEFQWHVRKGSKIIPLIMPGYFDEVRRAKKTVNYCHWWPGTVFGSVAMYCMYDEDICCCYAHVHDSDRNDDMCGHCMQIICRPWKNMHSLSTSLVTKI
jgi:hypothetical protein